MSEKSKKGGFTGTLVALIAKSAKLLKFMKFFKVAKPLVMFASMSISAIAYAFWLGPWLAILFIALLFIHEMGHVVAMRIKGLGTPTPVFIPFLGAAVFAPKFKERETEAFVGYGGPLLGTLGCLAVLGLYFLVPKTTTLSSILLVGSYLGTYLNLFNLLPISPLDGGRVTQAAGRWFKFVGLFALAIISVVWQQPVILYIWILVLYDLTMLPVKIRAFLMTTMWISMATLMWLGYGSQPMWANIADCIVTVFFVGLGIARAFKHMPDEEPDERPDLSPQRRVEWFLYYLGLAGILVVALLFQAKLLPHPV